MKIIITLLLLFTNFGTAQAQDSTSFTGPEKNTSEREFFNKVESEASSNSSWAKFLRTNIDYTTPVFNDAPPGAYKVIIQFVVNVDGTLGDFKALTKKGYGMEREVIRALKKSPPWTPAFQNGKAVKAIRVQPVVFHVDD